MIIAQGDLFRSIEGSISPNFSGEELGGIVSTVVFYIFPLAGIILLLYLIYGGYTFMLSGGDPKKTAKAQGILTTAILGFVIIFISYWLVQIVGRVLGIQIIIDIFG